jgi:hypothetical protein
MSDLDNRVTKLEVRVDGHDKEIAKVNSVTDALSKSLFDIKQNLTQIKWIAVGVGGAFAFQVLDLKDFIKLVFAFI